MIVWMFDRNSYTPNLMPSLKDNTATSRPKTKLTATYIKYRQRFIYDPIELRLKD